MLCFVVCLSDSVELTDGIKEKRGGQLLKKKKEPNLIERETVEEEEKKKTKGLFLCICDKRS